MNQEGNTQKFTTEAKQIYCYQCGEADQWYGVCQNCGWSDREGDYR